jgi:hypothetical protein
LGYTVKCRAMFKVTNFKNTKINQSELETT